MPKFGRPGDPRRRFTGAGRGVPPGYTGIMTLSACLRRCPGGRVIGRYNTRSRAAAEARNHALTRGRY